MAIKRVTISDIAKECGFSRNTVSKVFNGRGSVPETTKQFILQKAQELGYGVFSEAIPSKPAENRGISAVWAILLKSMKYPGMKSRSRSSRRIFF